jgi:hypothetical protein
MFISFFLSNLICENFHFWAFGFSHFICVHLCSVFKPYRESFFRCINDEEKLVSMMLCKTFLHLLQGMWDFTCYVGQPCTFAAYFSIFDQWIDIVISLDGVWMLVEVIIVDLIYINLVSQVTSSFAVVATSHNLG